MFTFETFEPGVLYGEHTIEVDEVLLEGWRSTFPDWKIDRSRLPLGFFPVVVMRAYAHIISPRPPGNIHGSQSYALRSRLALGDIVTTSFSCVEKTVKNDRKFVRLASRSLVRGALVCEGGHTSIVSE